MQPADDLNHLHHPLTESPDQPGLKTSRFHHFSGFYNFLNRHSKQVLGASILISGAILGITVMATGSLDNRNQAFTGFESVGLGTVDFSSGNFQQLGALATPVTPDGKVDTIKRLYQNLIENYPSANTVYIEESGAQITASSVYDAQIDQTAIFIRTVNLPMFDTLILRSYLITKETKDDQGHSVAEFHQEDGHTIAYIATQTPGNLTDTHTGVTLSYDTPDSEGPVVIMLDLTF